MAEAKFITIEAIINCSREKVWEYWTKPEHIVKWNQASEDWYCPSATNDLVVGGKFCSRMEARDGSNGFDFEGTYTQVQYPELIDYELGDGRKVHMDLIDQEASTKVIIVFQAENVYAPEYQQQGWQSILNNFKSYVEGLQVQ